jgi:hypothetical protein
VKGLYFLPQWYKERVKAEKGKKLKFTVVLLLIINLLLVNMFIVNKNKLTNLDGELKNSVSRKSSVHYKSGTFECFLNFYEYIWKGKTFKDISIQNKDINFNVEGEENCLSLIKNIENTNKFIIKDLKCLEITDGEKKIWQINLRLK